MGIKLPLITTHNPKANGKVEWQDSLTIKALIKLCDEKPSDWPQLLPFAKWIDKIAWVLL